MSGSDDQHEDDPKRGKLKRRLKAVLVFVLLAALLVFYNVGCAHLAKNFDARQERDPDTGILIGAAPRHLGPKNAETAILFVHGFVGAGSNFNDVPDKLAAEGYRVHVMRLPGHGTTPFDFASRSAEEILNAVREAAHALKAEHERVIVCGHSMGGALTTIAASQMELDGIILAAPYYRVTYQWYYLLPVEFWNRLTLPVVRWVYKGDAFIRVAREEAKPDILSYRWIPAEGSAILLELGRRAYNEDTLTAITEPVLLLHGDFDFAASPNASKTALDLMASESKTHVRLHESDHHIFWDFDREEVYAEILKFVSENVSTEDNQN